MAKVYEVNFDGLVGPTHNYAGLAAGNKASEISFGSISNPRAAALQGLEKMKYLKDLGLLQAYLPPLERPYLDSLDTHNLVEELEFIRREDPKDFKNRFSAAYMWTANAAMVSPSVDTKDGKVHMTVANLVTNAHRAIEAGDRFRQLDDIFAADCFTVHPSLKASIFGGDEGAANHCRISSSHAEPGIELFVYGDSDKTEVYRSRQSLQSCVQIATQHELYSERVIYAEQNPRAVDLGVFHNDVISVSNEYVFLYHEEAFLDTKEVITELTNKYQALYRELTTSPNELCLLPVSSEELSIEEAVSTYLFNSQIITLADGEMLLVAPSDCEENARSKAVVNRILTDKSNPINQVKYFNLKQSMANGGGPACLRLRVPLTEEELKQVPSEYLLNEAKLELLKREIEATYLEDLDLGTIDINNFL